MIELIVGRESGVPKEQARLALHVGDETLFIGAKGSVPATVSRMHCKISIGDDAKMTVENITSSNLLYINGREYTKRSGITTADSIELGPDRYKINLEEIFKKAPAIKPSYSIKHLDDIFNEYQQQKMDLQVSQGKLNALSALPGVMSMASIVLVLVFPDGSAGRAVMIGVAALFAIAFALVRYRNASKIPLKTRDIEERFRERYICPNPGCHHFMGMTPYKELLKNGCCPYCKSKFKE